MRVESNLLVRGSLRIASVQEVQSAPYQLVIDSTGNVKRIISQNPSIYQIDNFYADYFGSINIPYYIGNEFGSFNFKIEAQFGDLSNGAYRLAAQYTVVFSLVAYQAGISIVHTEPLLHITESSGIIVKLSDNSKYDLNINDIMFRTTLSTSNQLVIQIVNNIPAPYSGSIRCRYTMLVTKWEWQSGSINKD